MQHPSTPDMACHARPREKQFGAKPHVARVMGGSDKESKVQQRRGGVRAKSEPFHLNIKDETFGAVGEEGGGE